MAYVFRSNLRGRGQSPPLNPPAHLNPRAKCSYQDRKGIRKKARSSRATRKIPHPMARTLRRSIRSSRVPFPWPGTTSYRSGGQLSPNIEHAGERWRRSIEHLRSRGTSKAPRIVTWSYDTSAVAFPLLDNVCDKRGSWCAGMCKTTAAASS